MTHSTQDTHLFSYDYDLPEELIAQEPALRRDASRLMVLDRASGRTTLSGFRDIAAHLPEKALLVANNSRVVPARILGRRPTGGKVEMLLLSPLPLILEAATLADGEASAPATALLRSSKAAKTGERISFDEELSCTVLERGEFGRCQVELHWQGNLAGILERLGRMPLPPYIRRPADTADASRYQTVYANDAKTGSVAAPTAGLHFTPGLRNELVEAGHDWAEVTLYVGYGTFSPIRAEDIREHEMHAEYVEISRETAERVNAARAEGRPVLAVGTTTVRTLEGVAASRGALEPFAGWVNLFISPGFRFQVVDALLTNFHLPKSSLLVLVSAFAGREATLAAYERAATERMRFFSYGDAMLIR